LVCNLSAFTTLFATGKSWDNVRSTAAPYTESRLSRSVANERRFPGSRTTGVVYTGGKFAPGVVYTCHRYQQHNTGGKFAAGVVDIGGKFAANVFDTGGNFAAGVVDTSAP
jgi:hypothetical protein